MNGFLNVYKPTGMSSAAVVGKIKRATGEKRIGHAGTLDPEASGVLPIMLGRATRLFDFLVDKVKVYNAVCEFGTATDTQDAVGNVISTGENYPDMKTIEQAKEKLEGDIWQRPSPFSAIKQGGKPLYQRARDGEQVEAPLRLVHVDKIDILSEEENHGIRIRVHCGKGTYIRSICNDLGELVGCPAHMRSLCREQSGFFKLDDAMTIEEVQQKSADGSIRQHLIELDAPISHMPMIVANAEYGKLVRNGSKLPLDCCEESLNLRENLPVRIYMDGQFWGIVRREENMIRWMVQVPPEE